MCDDCLLYAQIHSSHWIFKVNMILSTPYGPQSMRGGCRKGPVGVRGTHWEGRTAPSAPPGLAWAHVT